MPGPVADANTWLASGGAARHGQGLRAREMRIEDTSIPGEKISFSFKGVEMQYMPQEASGAASKKLMTGKWPPSS